MAVVCHHCGMQDENTFDPFKKSHRAQLPGEKWQIIYGLVKKEIKLTADKIDQQLEGPSDEHWLQSLMALKNDLDSIIFRNIQD